MKRNNKKFFNKVKIIIGIIVIALAVVIFSGNNTIKNIIVLNNSRVGNAGEQSFTEPQLLSSVVSVGDYVQYDANSGGVFEYTTSSEKTGSTISSTFKSSDNMKWRVLSVDSSTGKVELISADGTPSRVKLEGETGIRFQIDLASEISAVYGHGYGAVAARSIKHEDIEKYSGITFGQNTYTLTSGYALVGNEIVNASTVPGGVTVVANFNAYPINLNPKNAEVADIICRDSNGNYKSFYVASRTYTGSSSGGYFYNMCGYASGAYTVYQPSAYYQTNQQSAVYDNQSELPILPIIELDSQVCTTGKTADGWTILNESEEDSKFFQANVEISKVKDGDFSNLAGSTFKIEDITEESDLVLKEYNAVSGEEVSVDEQGNFEIPVEGIVLSVSGSKREKKYDIKISEIAVPEGKVKQINYIILRLNVSNDDIITSKIIKVEDAQGREIDLSTQRKAMLIDVDENGESKISLDGNDPNLDIEYTTGDEPTSESVWTKYVDEVVLHQNSKVWARSKNKNGVTSTYSVKVINNIDKIAPSIDESTLSVTKNQTTRRSTLSVKIQDLESNESVAEGLKKYGASGIIKYGLSMSNETEPGTITELNQVSEYNVSIGDIIRSGTYYLWIWDAAGNIGKVPVTIDNSYEEYVARIISASATDGTDKYNHLVGTEYTTLRAAIDASPELGEGTATIQIIANIANESNNVDRDVTIDIAGHKVNSESIDGTTPTLDVLNDCKLYVMDSVGNGCISNTVSKFSSYNGQAVGIVVEENGYLQLGYDDGSVSIEAPSIEAVGYGIQNKGSYVDGEWNGGTLNFYDGKVSAEQAKISDINVSLAIYGEVTDTPIFWKVSVTNQTTPKVKQIATLAEISDAEARIGRKTYTQIEDAVADAGTKYGKNGEQVEIVLVNNLSKKKTVTIDKSKNIKLDLNGYVFTTQATGYVIDNSGDLEIVDTSEEQTGKIYGTTDSAIYNRSPSLNTTTARNIDITDVKKYNEELEENEGYFEYDGFLNVVKGIGAESNSKGYRNGYIELDLTDYEGWYRLQGVWNTYNKNYDYVRMSVTTEPMKLTRKSNTTALADRYSFNLEGGKKYYINLFQWYTNYENTYGQRELQRITLTKLNTKQLTITSGIFESNDGQYSINNEGVLVINGGNFTGSHEAILNNRYGNTIVNGGTLSSEIKMEENGGFLTINGGILSASIVISGDSQQINLNGGQYPATRSVVRAQGTGSQDSNIDTSTDSLIIVKDQTLDFPNMTVALFALGQYGNLLIDNCIINVPGTRTIYNSGYTKINNSTITTKYAIAGGREKKLYLKDSTVTTTMDTFTLVTDCEIENSTITSAKGVIIKAKDVLIKGNTNITSTNTMIDTYDAGNVIIESGKLESESEIIKHSAQYNVAFNNITIGKKDGEVVNTPILKTTASKSAIEGARSNVYFYDGKLVGKEDEVISAIVVDIEDNKEIISNINEDMEELTLGNYENIVENLDTGAQYNKLQDAIDAAPADESLTRLKLLKNINIAYSNYVGRGKNIEFDLYGHSIRTYCDEAIKNVGNLTLKSSIEDEDYNLHMLNTSKTILNDEVELDEGNVYKGNLILDSVKIKYKATIGGMGSSDAVDYMYKYRDINSMIWNNGNTNFVNVYIQKDKLGNIVNDGTGILTMESGKIDIKSESVAITNRGNAQLICKTGEINVDDVCSDGIICADTSKVTFNKVENENSFKITLKGKYGIHGIGDSSVDIEDLYVTATDSSKWNNRYGVYCKNVNIDNITINGYYQGAIYAEDYYIKNANVTTRNTSRNSIAVYLTGNSGTVENITVNTSAASYMHGLYTGGTENSIINANINASGYGMSIAGKTTINDATINAGQGIVTNKETIIDHADITASTYGINVSTAKRNMYI